MFPLIKITKGLYQINGHFFGLTFNPDAKIYCEDNCYRAQIFYKSGNVKTDENLTFRQAYNFLITNAVKPLFR